jgi:hypothetical protein
MSTNYQTIRKAMRLLSEGVALLRIAVRNQSLNEGGWRDQTVQQQTQTAGLEKMGFTARPTSSEHAQADYTHPDYPNQKVRVNDFGNVAHTDATGTQKLHRNVADFATVLKKPPAAAPIQTYAGATDAQKWQVRRPTA